MDTPSTEAVKPAESPSPSVPKPEDPAEFKPKFRRQNVTEIPAAPAAEKPATSEEPATPAEPKPAKPEWKQKREERPTFEKKESQDQFRRKKRAGS